MDKALWPECYICKRPVEKIEAMHDHCNAATVFIAYCHGEKEQCSLSSVDFMEYHIERGIAFYPRKLTAAKVIGHALKLLENE